MYERVVQKATVWMQVAPLFFDRSANSSSNLLVTTLPMVWRSLRHARSVLASLCQSRILVQSEQGMKTRAEGQFFLANRFVAVMYASPSKSHSDMQSRLTALTWSLEKYLNSHSRTSVKNGVGIIRWSIWSRKCPIIGWLQPRTLVIRSNAGV